MPAQLARFAKRAAFVLLALAIVYAILMIASSRTLRNVYLALQKGGRPMRADQIIPPPVPDADNAALLYQAAALKLKAERVGTINLFERLNDLSAAFLKDELPEPAQVELRRLFESEPTRAGLALVRDGVTRPDCRHPIDYSKGPAIPLPHLSDLRSLSRLLGVQARLQAGAGDLAAAWDTALASLRLATALDKEPILISMLVRTAQLRIAIDTIRELAKQGLPSEAQSAALDNLLTRFGDRQPFAMTMDAERLLMGEWCFARPEKELVASFVVPNDGHSGAAWGIQALRFSPIWNRDHAAYLMVMHRYTQMADEPFLKTDKAAEDELLRNVPRYCILTRLLVPALGAAKSRIVSGVADARITQAGLSMLRVRQAKGTLPESLAAAGAARLLDPFSGKPLLCKAAGASFTLYSIGPDLKDDGGSTDKGDDGKPRDLVWRF